MIRIIRVSETHILLCQKLKVPRSPGVFPLLLIQMFRKYSKIPQKLTFRGPPKPMFVYLVNHLVRENRSWHISKIWLPKLFQRFLMYINQLFIFLRTFSVKNIPWRNIILLCRTPWNSAFWVPRNTTISLETVLFY